jgi:hypothetical protein
VALVALGCVVALPALAQQRAADNENQQVFSGPQVGEKISGFKVRLLSGDAAGQEADVVQAAAGQPLVLLFVHKVTRPGLGLSRAVLDYAATLNQHKLQSMLVLLSDDATATEDWYKRASQAMPKDTPVGLSLDGQEGPGAYGLNRNVEITVLIAKENTVAANFALVQPSVPADGPRIAVEIAKLVGEKPPTAEQLGIARGRAGDQDPNLRRYLAPVIRKDASAEDVDKAVAELLTYLEKNPATKKQVGEAARRIVTSGKLQDYGTPKAQEYLKKFAEEFK